MSATLNVQVILGPADAEGLLRAEQHRSVPRDQLGQYAALAGNCGYGSGFHRETGEWVLAVHVVARGDGTASDAECEALHALHEDRLRPVQALRFSNGAPRKNISLMVTRSGRLPARVVFIQGRQVITRN